MTKQPKCDYHDYESPSDRHTEWNWLAAFNYNGWWRRMKFFGYVDKEEEIQ